MVEARKLKGMEDFSELFRRKKPFEELGDKQKVVVLFTFASVFCFLALHIHIVSSGVMSLCYPNLMSFCFAVGVSATA